MSAQCRRSPRPSAWAAKPTRAKCSTGWPAPGPIGVGRAIISRPRTTRAPSTTNTATCWPCRCARPIPRSGSTPACIGPTASTAPARGISMSTTPPASSPSQRPPTNIPSPTPASSSRSRMTWSATTASWICGCAKPGCSNTVLAPARIFRGYVERARNCPAADGLPAS